MHISIGFYGVDHIFHVSHACIEVLFVGVLLLKEGAKMAHFKIYLNKVDVCYMFTGATV